MHYLFIKVVQETHDASKTVNLDEAEYAVLVE